MKTLKNILNWFIFLLGGKGEIRKEAERDGICYYGGQE